MTSKYLIRKLSSLDYPDFENFDIIDNKQYRFLVAWLENRFICHYDPPQRERLNDVNSQEWPIHYDKYLADLKVPFTSNDANASLNWILELSVQNYYMDNNEKSKFSLITGEQFRKNLQTDNLKTSIDNIDISSDEFKVGVYQLATILGVAHHPDHMRVLRACSMVIVDKLTPANITAARAEEGKIKVDIVDIDQTSHGLHATTTDADLKRVAVILRLIHIHNFRKLQMDINSVSIAVQEIVAEPTTNEKLGKVGY